MPKLIKLRLVLDVDIDPQGENVEHFEGQLNRIVRSAIDNGFLTGESEATVEKCDFKVIKRRK
jgi:hypothetical protein